MAYISKVNVPDDETTYDIKSKKTAAIPFGKVDSTSTSTAFTATVDGITELYDGVCVFLMNGVVTSAEGYTININGLGAKPVYSSMAAATRTTTVFNVNYTALLIYNSTRVTGGCWDFYYGYYTSTNSIGYQLRTNSNNRPVSSTTYRYRICFSSPDNSKWVPANNSTSTNATSSRTVNQEKINPFGEIVYYSYTTARSAGTGLGATYQWSQYNLTVGYSFNRTGAALVLPYPKPFYVKCAPQTDGTAIIDADTPYVTELPSTEDGKIYIYLGQTYSATQIELVPFHPVYEYKGGHIRLWTNAAVGSTITIDPDPTSGSTNAVSSGGVYTALQSKIGSSDVPTYETDPTVPSWAKASSKPTYTAAEVGALPDSTVIPTKTSDLTNDSGLISSETDPTVPSWAKASTKPSYTASEVGALPDSTVIPSKTSDLTNDSGFISSETDPTVPSWAKASSKPTYTASEVGALPDTTVIPVVDGTPTSGSTNAVSSGGVYTAINNVSGCTYLDVDIFDANNHEPDISIDKTYSLDAPTFIAVSLNDYIRIINESYGKDTILRLNPVSSDRTSYVKLPKSYDDTDGIITGYDPIVFRSAEFVQRYPAIVPVSTGRYFFGVRENIYYGMQLTQKMLGSTYYYGIELYITAVPSWAKALTKPSYSGSEISITDTGGYFTTDTVEAALQQLGASVDGIETLLAEI